MIERGTRRDTHARDRRLQQRTAAAHELEHEPRGDDVGERGRYADHESERDTDVVQLVEQHEHPAHQGWMVVDGEEVRADEESVPVDVDGAVLADALGELGPVEDVVGALGPCGVDQLDDRRDEHDTEHQQPHTGDARVEEPRA